MQPQRPPEFIHEVRITRGSLPHIEEPGGTYYVTLCLERPAVTVLSQAPSGGMLVDAIRYHDGQKYYLFDYTVMPDHVHMILKPIQTRRGWYCLARLLYNLKQFTAREINGMLDGAGHVWQAESHDHLLRKREDYEEKAKYLYNNPHAKGLIDDPSQWPWWGRGSGAYL